MPETSKANRPARRVRPRRLAAVMAVKHPGCLVVLVALAAVSGAVARKAR